MYNQSYINAILTFDNQDWVKSNIDVREKSAQKLIDFYCIEQLHMSPAPRLALVDFKDNSTSARYNPNTNEIEIRKELFENGIVTLTNGKTIKINNVADKLFFYITHEAKHAEQYFLLNNPHLCANKNRLVLLQNNQRCTGELNSYFSINKNIDMYTNEQRALYMLQPSEREAWLYAHGEAYIFIEALNRIFPEKARTYRAQDFSDFMEIQIDAPKWFKTNSPTKDIDNILLAINGHKINSSLNEYMCRVVENTQDSHIVGRLVEYLNNCYQAEFEKKDYTDISELFQNQNDIDGPNIGG